MKLEIYAINYEFVRIIRLIVLEVRVSTPISKAESWKILDEVEAEELNSPLLIIMPDPDHVISKDDDKSVINMKRPNNTSTTTRLTICLTATLAANISAAYNPVWTVTSSLGSVSGSVSSSDLGRLQADCKVSAVWRLPEL